jgi:hypothetical protein
MNAAPAWIKLRDYFAAVYRSPGDIELMMDEAGFPRGEVSAWGDPKTVWHRLFYVGEAMGKIYVMGDLASRDHPKSPELQEALRTYVESLEEALKTKEPEVRQLTIRLAQQLGQSIDRFHRLFEPLRPDVGWSALRLDIATMELQNTMTRLAGELQEAKEAVGASPRPFDLPEFVDKAAEALQLHQRFQESLAILVSPGSNAQDRKSELRRFRPLGERLAAALEGLRYSMADEILPHRRAAQS